MLCLFRVCCKGHIGMLFCSVCRKARTCHPKFAQHVSESKSCHPLFVRNVSESESSTTFAISPL